MQPSCPRVGRQAAGSPSSPRAPLCVLNDRPKSAGLLSTEAGTLGRFAGNALLSVAGRLTGVRTPGELARFSSALHLSLAAGCAAVLGYVAAIFGWLAG